MPPPAGADGAQQAAHTQRRRIGAPAPGGQIQTQAQPQRCGGTGEVPGVAGAPEHHAGTQHRPKAQPKGQRDRVQGAPQRPDAQQRRQIPLLRRGVPAHPEGEEPGGKGGQGQLGDKADDPGELPALFRQIDEPGQRPHEGGAQRHEKPGGVEFQVIEGEGHRVDQDGRGGVAKGVHQRLGEHIAHDRPHQGAEAPGPRPGGGQIAQ